jgi:hypothetical protein
VNFSPLSIPLLQAPIDQSFTTDRTPTFVWTRAAVSSTRRSASAPATGSALTYTLQYGADSTFANVTLVADIPETTYAVPESGNLGNGTWYWRVDAYDGIQHSGYQESPYRFGVFKAGDQNHDHVISSADVIYLVNYIFKAGPAPQPCIAAGDVNCSGGVSSADIIYMVNFVFKSGPGPGDIGAMIADGTWSCP